MAVPVEANSYSTGHALSLVFHQCPLIITRMQSFLPYLTMYVCSVSPLFRSSMSSNFCIHAPKGTMVHQLIILQSLYNWDTRSL